MKQDIRSRMTLLGFLMSCVIVVYHVPLPTAQMAVHPLDSGLLGLEQILMEDLAAVAMCYFFAATGYKLFSCPPGQSFLTVWPQKLRRRVGSLLVPYVLWRFLAALRPLLTGQLTPGQLLLHSFDLSAFPWNGPIWYIYVVFLFAVTAPLLYCLLADRRLGMAAVLASVLLTAFLKTTDIPWLRAFADYGRLPSTIRYTPAYVLGAFYGLHCSREPDYRDLRYLLAVIAFALCINDYFPRACFDTAITVAPISLLYFYPVSVMPCQKRPVRLGFLIYVTHSTVLGVLQWRVEGLLPSLPLPGLAAELLGKAFCFGCCYLAADLLHRLLNRFAPRALQLLTGGRA